ncbi:DNA cytosine methyltransferase [Staphylococcus chromogenes]|uniref:DNA cytosine methyltransferase n=1 Tax=Staphylococcus chromogenes TaxID=46126 RepID=UPI002885976F|nr:DNA cytosine methyltransferase [Staphylococcus chromogenes]MDT0700337.1 DNA cytosine methyltransferase [Staphylococcus chromogenes]
MLKVLELFSGVGSFSVVLKTLGIEHEIVGYSEIRPTAVGIFCKIHNKSPEENLGDVKNVSVKGMEVDLLTFGSPCQNFSRGGKGEGGTKNSNTKSALMWEAVRVMNECQPKFIVWENVPDALNKKHKSNFDDYMKELDEIGIGYNTYFEVLNAHELGSAQKRKRLFAVSIRKDIDNGRFEFIKEIRKPKPLIAYLDTPESYETPRKDIHESLVLERIGNDLKIFNGNKIGFMMASEGDAIDLNYHSSKTRRGRVQKSACHTLLRIKSIGTYQNGVLRYLTPLEHWRLQEMPEQLYTYIKESDLSTKDKYDVVGGAINQCHLEVVFKSLDKAFNLNNL